MTSPPQTLRDALRYAHQAGLARLDAAMLLLHVLDRSVGDRAWLLAHDMDPLDPTLADRFSTLVSRRALGEPVAYLVGQREFYGLNLQVDSRVLDPRPDTETLVDWALELLRPHRMPSVLDLGTGSGAIALAVQHYRPDARVTAIDRSADALAVAQGNARRLGLPVQFVRAHWLRGIGGPFTLIVSNPPYIAADDPHLPALHHEPLQALVAGPHGLDDLRIIVRDAGSHLSAGGWLLLEHGWDQAQSVCSLLRAAGFVDVESRTDLAGLARCSAGRRDGI